MTDPEIDRLTAELEDAEQRADGFRTERDQAQATLARVRALAEEDPVSIDTADLLGILGPATPAATGATEPSTREASQKATGGPQGFRVRAGQIYRSLGDPYPHAEPRRIKIVAEPITTPGLHDSGKVHVVTLTDTGREIRRRPLELAQLHPGDRTADGKPRHTGYALEGPVGQQPQPTQNRR